MSKEITPSIEHLYIRVKGILDQARSRVYQTANYEMVQAYWNIGKEIIEEEQKGEERAKYRAYIVEGLSKELTAKYGKGFNPRNLFYMKQFYTTFPKVNALRSELSWTHYRLLLKIDREEAREFYMEETVKGNWSTRQLERQINSLFYDRILMSRDKQGMIEDGRALPDKMGTGHIIKDPFVLEFLDVRENKRLAEKNLESALIDKLQQFLLELGTGFSFVRRQYRITADTDYFYIDLVFYNYILKCFLLIDLKTEKLSHGDIGQMDFYVRFFEDKIKQEGDNPTIGLILCTEKNKTIVKYSLLSESKQIFASMYQTYLPTVEQFEQEIEREKDQFEQEKRLSED